MSNNNNLLMLWMQHAYSNSDGSHVAEPQPKDILKDKTIFPDFKSGPLKAYREKASFCHKRMNVLLEGEDHIRLKVSIS